MLLSSNFILTAKNQNVQIDADLKRIEIVVEFTSMTNLYAAQFDLAYDAQIFSLIESGNSSVRPLFIEWSNRNILQNRISEWRTGTTVRGVQAYMVDENNGVISYAATKTGKVGGDSGNIKIAAFTFDVIDFPASAGDCNFEVTNAKFTSVNNGVMTDFGVADADIKIISIANPDEEEDREELTNPRYPEAPRDGTAAYGTPVIGSGDALWETAEILQVDKKLWLETGSFGIANVLWDESNLYVRVKVTDPVLNASGGFWEHDSVEIFFDEYNSKTIGYADTDGMDQYRVNYQNYRSGAAVPADVISYAEITGEGYIIEMKLPFRYNNPKKDYWIGFDIQINDSNANGQRTNITTWGDETGNAWENGSLWGQLLLLPAPKETDKSELESAYDEYSALTKGYCTDESWVTLQEALAEAKAVLDNPDATQDDVDDVLEVLEYAYANLVKFIIGEAKTGAENIMNIAETSKGIWTVTFTIEIPCTNGEIKFSEYIIEIEKNGDGEIDLGKLNELLEGYILKYDIKGNGSNVKLFEIVNK